jgi:hypothetical protein
MNIHDGAHVFGLEQIPDGEEGAVGKVVDIELQLLQEDQSRASGQFRAPRAPRTASEAI